MGMDSSNQRSMAAKLMRARPARGEAGPERVEGKTRTSLVERELTRMV